MANSRTKNLPDSLSLIFFNSIQKSIFLKPKKARKIRSRIRLLRKRKRSTRKKKLKRRTLRQGSTIMMIRRRKLKNKRRYKLNIRKKQPSKNKHPKR